MCRVAMLLDTKGPEIRTKLLKDGRKVTLTSGSQFILSVGDFEGDEHKVAITYEELYKDVKPGGKILIDDGLDRFGDREDRRKRYYLPCLKWW